MKKPLYSKKGLITKEGLKVSDQVSSFLKTIYAKGYDTRQLSLLISEDAIFLSAKTRQAKKQV